LRFASRHPSGRLLQISQASFPHRVGFDALEYPLGILVTFVRADAGRGVIPSLGDTPSLVGAGDSHPIEITGEWECGCGVGEDAAPFLRLGLIEQESTEQG
jgi:hypothetical protein